MQLTSHPLEQDKKKTTREGWLLWKSLELFLSIHYR